MNPTLFRCGITPSRFIADQVSQRHVWNCNIAFKLMCRNFFVPATNHLQAGVSTKLRWRDCAISAPHGKKIFFNRCDWFKRNWNRIMKWSAARQPRLSVMRFNQRNLVLNGFKLIWCRIVQTIADAQSRLQNWTACLSPDDGQFFRKWSKNHLHSCEMRVNFSCLNACVAV